MKKLIALMLCLVLALSMSVTAFAEGEQTGTTTLTVTVPEPSYTMHIPADMTLEYGNAEEQEIGDVYVTNVVNVDSSIVVHSPYTDLKNSSNTEDTIAMSLFRGPSEIDQSGQSGAIVYDKSEAGHNSYDENGYAKYTYYAKVNDWSGATAGAVYQATITWNFKIN